jgi:hypothetical protein
MRTRLWIAIIIILISVLCTAVANSRASWAGSMTGQRLPAKEMRDAVATNEARTLVAVAGSTAAPGWREPMSSATNYSAPRATSLLLWSGSLVSAARTRLRFLSALTSVNATTALTFDSTEGADITLVLKFSDIAQGAVVANPISSHTPPNACQGATFQHGLQADITPIPGAIIIPPQPNPPLADPAIISSAWRDCQGEIIEQWVCYIYSVSSAPREKFRPRCRLGCVGGVRG